MKEEGVCSLRAQTAFPTSPEAPPHLVTPATSPLKWNLEADKYQQIFRLKENQGVTTIIASSWCSAMILEISILFQLSSSQQWLSGSGEGMGIPAVTSSVKMLQTGCHLFSLKHWFMKVTLNINVYTILHIVEGLLGSMKFQKAIGVGPWKTW